MGLLKKRGKHIKSANTTSETDEQLGQPSESAGGEEAIGSASAGSDDDVNKPEPMGSPEPEPGPSPDDSSDPEKADGDSSGDDDEGDDGDGGEPVVGADGLPDEAFEPREYVEEDFDEDEPAQSSAFVAAEFANMPSKKKHRGLKAFGITVGVLAIVVGIAYIVGAVVFMGRFLPYTVIGDYDVSLKTDAEVAEMLESVATDYQIDVVGNGFSYRADGADLGLAIDSAGILEAMHQDLDSWRWPLLVIEQKHDESDQMAITFSRAAYESDVMAAIAKHNESATPPTNATIVFDEKNSKFVVKSETVGTQLDGEAVLAVLDEAITALQPKLILTDEQLLQPTVLSTDKKLNESAELATGMVSADLTLVMGGRDVAEVNGESLSQFVTINDSLDVTFKEDEMNSWVESLAQDFNTVGKSRSYTRADGKQVTVEGGVYGWEVDTEALKNAILDGIKAGEVAEVEVPCSGTADVFNGVGERDWGKRYVDVDISEQHVRFYGDDGKLFWETDCISGSPDGTHDTVPGVWYVNAKESPSKLIGYENGKKIYETTVKFWMPFEGNGIGFHDATWQPSFGGAMYANGYGSHGCVNLSYAAAEELYGLIQEGDVVVVHA